MDNMEKYLKDKLGISVRRLPQNIKKDSVPANLVRKYGNSDANCIVWLYHNTRRYVGVLVRNKFLNKKVVNDWFVKTAYRSKNVYVGKEYTLCIFK